MKANYSHITKTSLLLLALLSWGFTSFSQNKGRVVINEYMPWTLNGCGATSEFVELMNFGPGPMNIGCYILTDGDFSVTIPPNTILQPGQYYVIAGQDIIAKPCANIDSTIHAQLNWNNCNCTSGAIPTTGDGWFTDGGSANEQVVLLDPSLNVVDAVVRSLPLETSTPVTTSSIGGCTPKTFDLNTLNITYETLGMSTGRGNSFARKLDGDCGWVKDPQQSAHATNNTSGTLSDISYDFTVINGQDCSGTHGSIEIYVKHSNYEAVFPMKYTIAKDINNNGIFDFNDEYTYGSDSTPPDIFIDGFGVGTYRLVVESVMGCYLHTFDFTILPCYGVLPVKLIDFKLAKSAPQTNAFAFTLNDVQNLKSVTLEKGSESLPFTMATTVGIEQGMSGSKSFAATVPAEAAYTTYRLRITGKDGSVFYSPVINLKKANSYSANKIWPNPAKDKLQLQLTSPAQQKAGYAIYGLQTIMASGQLQLSPGTNTFALLVNNLPDGVYQLAITPERAGEQPISFRFVIHK